MTSIQLNHVGKRFGKKWALDDITLKIDDKRFTCILGPSGAGKTTLLRTIAGLEKADAGTIRFGGQEITQLPLQKRDVAMVFQDFTLYPNLSVFENIASPLRARKAPKAVVNCQVKEVAETLQIDPLLNRFPRQLSGGEMQRVAIARAIAKRPAVYLFDEILVNLDYKIREQMRTLLKDLSRHLGSTVIYATPDPLDALSLAEKVVVLKEGRVRQVGETFDVYRHPADSFVGQYFGYPEMNLVEGRLSSRDGAALFRFQEMALEVTLLWPKLKTASHHSVILGIRPEDIYMGETLRNKDDITITARLRLCEIIGSDTILHLKYGDMTMKVFVPKILRASPGEDLCLHFGLRDAHFFSPTDARLICRG